jgi:hypothetical protein
MKTLAIAIALAALSGCATTYPGPANYGTRAYAQPADPNGWKVVSVTPVPAGTGASATASGTAGTVTYQQLNPAPANVYGQTVYVPTPVYAPAPVYVDPWYPPISIGLGFNFGHWSGGHWGGHRGYGRGWGRGHR